IGFTMVEGVFSFVSGQISKSQPDAMVLKTPVATIGIRGTDGHINLAPPPPGQPEPTLTILITPPPGGGAVGEITVTNNAGVVVLNQPFQASSVASLNLPVGQPFT